MAINCRWIIRGCESPIEMNRGTKLMLHFKEGQLDYLNYDKLKSIIVKHSNFISYPIKLYHEYEKDVTDSDDSDEDENNKNKKTKKILLK